MTLTEKFEAARLDARERLADASQADRLRMFGHGLFESYAEAVEDLPSVPANDNLAEPPAAFLRRHAQSIRTYVARHGSNWLPHVRERWLVGAEESEDRAARLDAESAGSISAAPA